LYATFADDRWYDRRIDRWELSGSKLAEQVVGSPARATDFCVLPDGRLIASGHRAITDELDHMPVVPVVLVVDPTGREPPWEFPTTYFPLKFIVSPAGDRVLTRGHHYRSRGYHPEHRNFLLSYRLPLRQPAEAEWKATIRPLPNEFSADLWWYRFDPSGKRVLTIEAGSYLPRAKQPWTARWRSTTSGKAIGQPIRITGLGLNGMDLAVGGTRLLGCDSATIFSFDLSNPDHKPTRTTNPTRKHFTGLAVHPDGRRVFASNNDGTVREYDAVTLQELRAYDWKVGKLTCVAVAPDGMTAAVGSDTGKVVVWDLE